MATSAREQAKTVPQGLRTLQDQWARGGHGDAESSESPGAVLIEQPPVGYPGVGYPTVRYPLMGYGITSYRITS